MAERETLWQLAAWQTDEDGGSTLTLGRVVGADELRDLSASTGLLTEALEASAYAKAEAKYENWRRALSEVSRSSVGGPRGPAALHRLSGALDDLLAAVRAFDDHTKHALSRRYGRDSPELRHFGEALSAEFDGTFAYRFCWKLRNYSQHCGSPISNIRAGSRLVSGQVQDFFNPVFDSRKLLADYGEWGRHVKADLRRIAGEFSVVVVVDALWTSCQRAYSKTLADRETELMAAAERIRHLAQEAAPNGESPVLVKVDDLRHMTIQAIRVDLADLAETVLQQAAAVVGVRPDHLN